ALCNRFQKTRLMVTTVSAMTTTAAARAPNLASLVTRLIRAPRPKASYVFPPCWTYSATMLAFHAPPAEVIHPVTRNGKIPGKIKYRKESHPPILKMSAHETMSEGMDCAPAATLKRIYHWAPSIIKTTEPQPRFPPSARIHPRTNGYSIGAGKEAANCTTG